MSERPLRGARLATAAIGALLLYLVLVLLVDARIGRHVLSLPRVLLLFAAGTAPLHVGIRRAAARGRIGRGTLLNLSLLSAALLVSLVAVDLAVSAYLGLSAPPTDVEVLARHDRNASVGEWYPRPYYPTAKNFRLHKPGFTVTGSHYGGFYLPAMLGSRTLVDSVLDRRRLTIRIDSLGFRDTGAAAGCPIF
ncbi:MAG TPA: hypothetical protein VFT84_08805, partial [Gemmatimonadales bacterium]|nr:hypothetical protein [Gemmatimonadales bacterium]